MAKLDPAPVALKYAVGRCCRVFGPAHMASGNNRVPSPATFSRATIWVCLVWEGATVLWLQRDTKRKTVILGVRGLPKRRATHPV